MASILQEFPGELRLPDLTPLSDGRYRMTRYLQFPAPKYEVPAYGTLFDRDAELTGDEAARYSGMRLILADPGTVPNKPSVPGLTLVYEQIDAEGETQVGKLRIETGSDGRDYVVAQFIQFSVNAYVRGDIGVDEPPGYDRDAVLDRVEMVDQGILRTITRYYLQATDTPEQIGDVRVDDIEGAFVGTHASTYIYVAGQTKSARQFTYQYLVKSDGTVLSAQWLALNTSLAAGGGLPARYYVGGRVVRKGTSSSVIERVYFEKPDTYSYPRADSHFFEGKIGVNGNIPVMTKPPQTRVTTKRIQESYHLGPVDPDALTWEPLAWASGSVQYIPALNNPSNFEGTQGFSFSGCIGRVTLAQIHGYFQGKKVTSVVGLVESEPTDYPTGEELIRSEPVRWAGQIWKKTNVYVTYP